MNLGKSKKKNWYTDLINDKGYITGIFLMALFVIWLGIYLFS